MLTPLLVTRLPTRFRGALPFGGGRSSRAEISCGQRRQHRGRDRGVPGKDPLTEL